MTSTPSRRDRIRDLNDAFRAGGMSAGHWMLTRGVASLGPDLVARATRAVRNFDRFTPDNDPHGEHDFGSFELVGEKLFWKIDYYDRTPQGQRGRDLADITHQLEITAGAKDTPEREAFKRSQAELGDQISQEPDSVRRGELRHLREAQGHLYAAQLTDQIGGQTLAAGRSEDAKAMQQLGDLHREIAGAIRGRQEPDRDPDGPPGGPKPEGRQQFAQDVAAVGREVLGQPTDNVMTGAGPEPQRPEATPTRAVIVGQGLGGAELMEIAQSRPDVEAFGPAELTEEREAVPEGRKGYIFEDPDARAAYDAHRKSADLEEAKQPEITGASPRQTAREALQEVRREAEKEREAEGPAREESAQGRGEAGAAFRSFGR